MDSYIIDFGIFEDFSITFNTSNITNIFSLNHRECIASTSKEIIRFERKIIKSRYPYTFSSCLIVPDTEYIIGVTFKYGTLTVFRLSDISEPILKDYQTNHHGIFHMFYSAKSNSIITIGSGIRVFTFHYMIPDKKVSIVNPKVSFTQRSSFASDYDTTILTPPPFDSESELIYLPTSNGICPFTLDGKQLNPYTRIPSTIKTVYTFNTQSKELLTYDSTDGMSLWGPSDNLICHLSTAGSSLIAMLFYDKENVICINSFNSLFFLNIKTGRTFHCLTLHQRPTRLFLIDKTLFVCFANTMKAMKIVVPWKVWNLNVKETVKIERCDKFCESARILIAARGSFVKLYTPKSGEKVTVATPSIAVNSTSLFYDRGMYERYIFNKEKGQFMVKVEKTLPGTQRDILFVVLEDGKIIGFNTTVSPCDEVMSVKTKAVFMTICRHCDKWCYAVASANSDLYILDYQNLKETHHFTVVNDRLLKFFYHDESDSIVMIFSKKTLLFDLKKGQIADVLPIDGNNVTSLFSNMLKYGYESGHIAHVEIENGRFVSKEKSAMQRPHSEAVSYFSFSLNFWISVGVDGKVIFWNYSNEKICQISFPIALRAGAIMNGKRDVLVATDSEVMIIEGTSVFDRNEVDREVSEIDNFDRLNDNLSSEVVFPLPSHESDEEEALLRSKKADESEYDYEEEEDVKEKVAKIQSINKIENSPNQTKDGENIQKKIIVEDNEEEKKKKLEAMQALNGMKKILPKMEEQKNGEESNKKSKNKKKPVFSRHDDKSINNFIENSIGMEKEKNETKTKKEKSVKKRRKESNKSSLADSKELKSEDIFKSSEKFDETDQNNDDEGQSQDNDDKNDENQDNNDETDQNNENQDNNDDESQNIYDENENQDNNDDDESIVLKMKEDKKEMIENDDETKNNHQHEDEIKEKTENQTNKEKEKPRQQIESKKAATEKTLNTVIKESKSSSHKEENSKTIEKPKKNLISIGTQPDIENRSSTKEVKKSKEETKHNQQKPATKPETKQTHSKPIEKAEPKQKAEKVEQKKKDDEQKPSKKPKTKSEPDTKSDKKTKQKPKQKSKNKETKSSTKPPTTNPPHDQSHKKDESQITAQKVQSKPKSDLKPLNFKQEEIERKPIKPQKNSDPLTGKRPRCPTPPLIRWKKPAVTRKPRKRASTPPMRNERPIMYAIPPPNVVLDKSAILEYYGRGKTELKPLVDLINEEEERVRMSFLYYACHVKNFGSLSRFYQSFSPSLTIKPPIGSPRQSYRSKAFQRKSYVDDQDFNSPRKSVTFNSPPTGPSFFGVFFFSDDYENDRNRSEVNKNDKNENLPKFHKMQYAPPLNLIDQKKKHPQIRIPKSSSPQPRKDRLNTNIHFVEWPDNVSKSSEIESGDLEVKNEDVLTFKPSNINHVPQSASVRNSEFVRNSEEPRPNWSLFYPNFEGCREFVGRSNERGINHEKGVDLLANAVMMKMPSLELPVSNGYKRTKSVRMRSPQQSRRTVPGMFFHPYERRK